MPATCQRAMTKQHASGDFSMKQPSTSNHGQASQKKSHVSDETDATEETREIVGVWNQSHERAPEGAQKVTGAGGPRAKPFGNRKAQKKPNQRVGPAHPRRSGEHGVEMARRRGRADKAAMRATRLLLVPALGRVTTSSSPTQQHQDQVRRTPYARLGIRLASHQTAPVPASTPSCSRPWRQSHACRLSRDHSPCRICRLLVC